jgi:hypothetical protein
LQNPSNEHEAYNCITDDISQPTTTNALETHYRPPRKQALLQLGASDIIKTQYTSDIGIHSAIYALFQEKSFRRVGRWFVAFVSSKMNALRSGLNMQ